MIQTMVCQGEHIKIALNHQAITGLLNGLLVMEKAEKQPTFIKDLGFRGVEVFGLAITDNTTAKTGYLPAHGEYGADDPFAESVIAAVVFGHQQACIHASLPICRVPAKFPAEEVPAVRGKSQLIMFNDFF